MVALFFFQPVFCFSEGEKQKEGEDGGDPRRRRTDLKKSELRLKENRRG